MARAGVKAVSGVLGETQRETIMHEANEAYIGAKNDPGGNFNTGYKNAHEAASKLDRVQNKDFDFSHNTKNNVIQIRATGTKIWKNVYKL